MSRLRISSDRRHHVDLRARWLRRHVRHLRDARARSSLRGAVRVDRVPGLRKGVSASGMVQGVRVIVRGRNGYRNYNGYCNYNGYGSGNCNVNSFGRTMLRIGADAADRIVAQDSRWCAVQTL